ncbi:MAG TPA: sulfite exporter TauE/SafE family protein [Acidimicrobiia bacterium]|nr:sulfite exporter TauE/SafE family protein [Acidimicrobiia bacterium]
MIEYLIAIVVGLLIGLLGSGGAIVAIPAFIYLANYTPKQASTTALVLVTISAIIATIGYSKKKQITYKDSAAFAVTGIVGSFAGTMVNRSLSDTFLLGLFAIVLFLAGISMLNQERLSKTRLLRKTKSSSNNIFLVLAIGLSFGFVTGLLGVGGGFLIVPLLVIVLHYKMSFAVGTSVTIIAFNAIVSLGFRATDLEIPVGTIIPLGICAVVGALAGMLLHDRVNKNIVKQAFVVLLFLLGTYTLIDFFVG